MDINSIYFLFFVALGAMIGTLTGFAMALIIIGGVAVFGLMDIGMAAAVISLISLVNVSLALRHSYKFVDKSYLKWFAISSLPMVFAGVWVLEYLSNESTVLLQKLLGLLIIVTGTMMMLKPTPFAKTSSTMIKIMTGGVGGFIGGMFGAGGAPYAYLMYRQPLDIIVIRSTLLGMFAVSTIIRIVAIATAGQIDKAVFSLSLLSVPVVILVTIATTKMLPLVPDAFIRKLVFILLIILGIFLILT